ncbi:hypothetical protein B0H16DRAFT_1900844 [Mycena metata]|uniref:Uncharacterized protein n=1 Tax=Mycena metata TaxID=1033252 RepID=A0AAD7MCM8_9AGAR|nr:hypothetical protein B0H16DRAFT_1900844 [Mycena metata]
MESASHLRTLLRRIVLADNDRLAAPSAPTLFVPLWAPSAACCKTKRGAPSLRVRPSDAKLAADAVVGCIPKAGTGESGRPSRKQIHTHSPSRFCLHIQRVRASVSFGWAPPADSGTIQHRRAPRKYATGR